MSMQSMQTVPYAVTAPSQILTMPRNYTRLNQVILTFWKPSSTAGADKQCEHFYLSPQQALRVFTQIGERRFPDLDIDNIPEFYHRTLHAIGVANSSAHSVAITPAKYKDNCFMYVLDLEAVPMAHASGINTQNSALVMHLDGIGSDSNDLPQQAFLTCTFEVLVSIGSDGVEVAT